MNVTNVVRIAVALAVTIPPVCASAREPDLLPTRIRLPRPGEGWLDLGAVDRAAGKPLAPSLPPIALAWRPPRGRAAAAATGARAGITGLVACMIAGECWMTHLLAPVILGGIGGIAGDHWAPLAEYDGRRGSLPSAHEPDKRRYRGQLLRFRF
jgi:hypothetical protein